MFNVLWVLLLFLYARAGPAAVSVAASPRSTYVPLSSAGPSARPRALASAMVPVLTLNNVRVRLHRGRHPSVRLASLPFLDLRAAFLTGRLAAAPRVGSAHPGPLVALCPALDNPSAPAGNFASTFSDTYHGFNNSVQIAPELGSADRRGKGEKKESLSGNAPARRPPPAPGVPARPRDGCPYRSPPCPLAPSAAPANRTTPAPLRYPPRSPDWPLTSRPKPRTTSLPRASGTGVLPADLPGPLRCPRATPLPRLLVTGSGPLGPHLLA